MTVYIVHGLVVGTKYLGEVEAESRDEAEELAWKKFRPSVSLCHACSHQVEDPEINELVIEERDE